MGGARAVSELGGLMLSAAVYPPWTMPMAERAPAWLRRVWQDIGGSPPPRRQGNCESSLNSRMQFEPSGKADVKRAPGATGELVAKREPAVKTEPEVRSEPQLEVGRVAMASAVKCEVKEAVQRPPLEGMRRRCVANVRSQWYCGACGKDVSCSNRAKHMKRIHPRALLVKRGRPKGDGKRCRWKGGRMARYAYEGIDIS